jgi:hypothetical protein
VTLTKDALQQWCELGPLFRRVVLATLVDLTEGRWNLQQEHQQQQQQGRQQQSGGMGVTKRQQLGVREMVDGGEDVWLALRRLARVKAYTTSFLQVNGLGALVMGFGNGS